MKLEFITTPSHPIYQRAIELYQMSFPIHEQREKASQEKILSNDEYHFSLVYDGDVFVGLALYWETATFIYIEHLCILPEMRNKHYGQRVLSYLSTENKVIILEIDPPVDDISIRRKGFYERCGFVDNPFSHIHPPYHKDNNGHELVIMTSPRQISTNEYLDFSEYLHTKVMKNVF